MVKGQPWLKNSLLSSIYSFLCHQLPERSFFLFGQQTMYSLAEIQYRWQPKLDPAILRQFIGDPATGWKMAWSDRMVALYTSIWLFAWVWWLLRKKIRPLADLGYSHVYQLVGGFTDWKAAGLPLETTKP